MSDMSGPLLARYSPGGWVGLAGPRTWLLADVDPADPVVAACWALARDGAAVDHVLGALLSVTLRPASDFALIRLDGAIARVVLRGSARASLTTAAGAPVDLIGAGGLAEHAVADVVAACLRGPSAGATPAALLLGSGMVQAGEIILSPAGEQEPVWDPARGAVPLGQAGPPSEPQAGAEAGGFAAPAADVDEQPTGRFTHMIDFTAPPTASVRTAQDIPADWIEAVQPSTPSGAGSRRPEATAFAADADLGQPYAQSVPPPDRRPTAASVTKQRGRLLDDDFAWAQVAGQQPSMSAVARPAVAYDQAATALPSTPVGGDPGAGPLVMAVRCTGGHLNPPAALRCRVCGADIPTQPAESARRPVLGVLRLSTGKALPLDRGAVLGRDPGQPPHGGPHHIRVASPEGLISRRHVEVVLDGWQVEVVDLGSTNGSVVTPPDGQPERLQFGSRRVIEAGYTVHLETATWFRYEVAP
jgi:hypothetical protein